MLAILSNMMKFMLVILSSTKIGCYSSTLKKASAVETMMTASESYEGGWPADNEEVPT